MTAAAKRQKTDSFTCLSIPAENNDAFQNEENLEEDYSWKEGEDDFETTLMAIKEGPTRDDITPATPKTNTRPFFDLPETVDDFFCNFLLKIGMSKTLDCFQTERNEMMRKGVLNTELVGVAPDVYTQTLRLDSKLQNAQRERDEYKSIASEAAETIAKLQKVSDFHRQRHKRVIQEKNRLVEYVRRLKIECGQPAVNQINERYKSILKQKRLVSLERDKALAQLNSLQATFHNMGINEGRQSLKHDKDARCQTKKTSKKITESTYIVENPRDSEFARCGNDLLLSMKDRSMNARVPSKTKADSFRPRSSIKAHIQPISCLACHPTKRAVASSSADRLWKLWGLAGGDLVATAGAGHTDWLSGISFHPDEAKLGTTGGDGSVHIWDLSKGHLALTLQGHTGVTWGCSFHPCGDFVASCSMDFTIKVWDLQSERCHSTLRGHSGSVNSVEFLTSCPNALLASSSDKTLSLWDARMSLCSHTMHGHSSSLNDATVSSDARAVASCDSSGVVMLWDIRNMVAPTVVVETGPKPSNQVAFDPWGQVLAVAGDDGLVRVIDLASNQVASVLRHEDAVQSVVFDHMGEYLLSGASDGQIYVWSYCSAVLQI